MEKKCEGECNRYDECKGEVKSVKVEGHWLKEPMFFDYCEEAIETDRAHGWTVTVLDNEEVEQTEEEKTGTYTIQDAVRKLRENFLEEGKSIPYGSHKMPTQQDIEEVLKAFKATCERGLLKTEEEEEDKE